jgi:hypothetical protein
MARRRRSARASQQVLPCQRCHRAGDQPPRASDGAVESMTAAHSERELSIVTRARADAERALARVGPLFALGHQAILHMQGRPLRRAVRAPARLRRVPAHRYGRAPRRGRRREARRRAASRGDPPDPRGRRRFAVDDDPCRNRPNCPLATDGRSRQAHVSSTPSGACTTGAGA